MNPHSKNPESQNKPVEASPKSEEVRVAELKLKSDAIVAFLAHLPFMIIAILVVSAFLYLRTDIKKSLPSVKTVEYAGLKIDLSNKVNLSNVDKESPSKAGEGNKSSPPVPQKFLGNPSIPALSEWKIAVRRALDVSNVLTNRKILWVDDHPESNKGVIDILNQFHINVRAVESNSAALALLDINQKFDLIITDVGRDKERDASLLRQDKRNKINDVGLILVQQAGILGYRDRILIYSAGFTTALVKGSRNWPEGAYGVTNQPSELLNQIIDICDTLPNNQVKGSQ